MRRYIEHIKNTRDPHQRRQHAMQAAGVLTAAVAAIWISTLGLRLGASDNTVAQSPDQTMTAASAAAQGANGPHLEVATTSVYSN
jgi:hypothetical protein